MLTLDRQLFQDNFNKRHFLLRHSLSDHPLFQLPRLIELARQTATLRPDDVYYDSGVTRINQRWGTAPCAYAVDETIERIETADAFIILKRVESDSAYARILHECMGDILGVAGPGLNRKMRRKEAIIFIASPRRVTTYHIDSECNFLLQLRGRKNISVFQHDDRDVLPEEEIERFWTADTNAAVFKPHLQHRADNIVLEPGTGLHIPVNAPHWARNGSEVSVALSINYHGYDTERAGIYCVNHYLRQKLGLLPTPPFQHRFLDDVKRPIGAAMLRMRGWYHGPIRSR
jgi:hypothetical protein